MIIILFLYHKFPSDHIKIPILSIGTKNAFNHFILCMTVFTKYKQDIYQDMYLLIPIIVNQLLKYQPGDPEQVKILL